MSDKLHDYGTLRVNKYCTAANIAETNHICYTANTHYPDISSNTVFQLEQKIVENINQINKDYSVLLRCTDVSGKNDDFDYNAEITQCPTGYDQNIADASLNALIGKTNNLVQVYNELIKMDRESDPYGVSFAQYNTNYKNIIQQYNDNLKLRTDLDLKLQELMQGDKSVSGIYKRSNETMVYTNVIWTVLASSFVYYIFVNLT